MKHKYYDAIVAWAEGRPIQYKYPNDSVWRDFLYGEYVPAFTRHGCMWRVKPEARVYYTRVFANYNTGITATKLDFSPARHPAVLIGFYKTTVEDNKGVDVKFLTIKEARKEEDNV